MASAGNTTSSIVALTGVNEVDSGLASGVNSAAFQIGGALGVSLVTTVAVSAGGPGLAGLTKGFQSGYVALVVVSALALLLALTLPRRSTQVLSPSV